MSPAISRSGLLPPQRVNMEEVLAHFASRSDVPSAFGNQIEGVKGRSAPDSVMRARRREMRDASREEQEHSFWNTMKVKGDPIGASRDEEARIESRLFDRARVLGCVDGLARYRRITFTMCPSIERFGHSHPVGQGSIVVNVLRSFEEWRTQSPQRGLAAVYSWLCKCPRREGDTSAAWQLPIHDEDSLAQAFRTGKAKVCHRRSEEIVADATIVLGAWVELWNRRAARVESS